MNQFKEEKFRIILFRVRLIFWLMGFVKKKKIRSNEFCNFFFSRKRESKGFGRKTNKGTKFYYLRRDRLIQLEKTSAETNQTIQFRGTINIINPIKATYLKK